jgi:hypothetical protein
VSLEPASQFFLELNGFSAGAVQSPHVRVATYNISTILKNIHSTLYMTDSSALRCWGCRTP